jgi:hypothetical protein
LGACDRETKAGYVIPAVVSSAINEDDAAVATFLSTPDSAGSQATPGERRFAARLRSHLEDDYLCWYDVPVGPKHRHPDFMILHPGRGLLILEIKDWQRETIWDANPEQFTPATATGHKVVGSPLKQVRQLDLLKADPQLTHPAGSPYAGQLTFPYGYGVVLTNITRHQFESCGLGEVLQPHLVICKDEMTESVDAEEFQSRLWGMFNVRFDSKLTLPQVERIRWVLFPQIRIHQQLLPTDSPAGDEKAAAPGDLLQVMDLNRCNGCASARSRQVFIEGQASECVHLVAPGVRHSARRDYGPARRPYLLSALRSRVSARLRFRSNQYTESIGYEMHIFRS